MSLLLDRVRHRHAHTDESGLAFLGRGWIARLRLLRRAWQDLRVNGKMYALLPSVLSVRESRQFHYALFASGPFRCPGRQRARARLWPRQGRRGGGRARGQSWGHSPLEPGVPLLLARLLALQMTQARICPPRPTVA